MSLDEILWTGHPSHWRYFWRWFWSLLFVAVGIAGRVWPPQRILPWAVALGCFVVGILILASVFAERARLTYTVTTRKVIYEAGLVAKSSDEVRIKDIRSIALKKHGFTGLLGVGDVEFSSAARDEADIIFSGISGATAIRDLVRKRQDADDEPAQAGRPAGT